MLNAWRIFIPLTAALTAAEVSNKDKNCTCGFLDSQTNIFFTDSLIIYFNETVALSGDFISEDYVRTYEKNWNSRYRSGADPKNVRFDDPESIQLALQPSSRDHIVKGSSLRTVRRDIQHGSFRALMRPSRLNYGGSALSMAWQYNDTEVSELSVMNSDDHSDAWIGTFINNEFTTRDLGINFTQLQNRSTRNREYKALDEDHYADNQNPWGYIEYRIDWTKDFIKFYSGGNLIRQVLHENKKDMPSVPAPLYLKHWSTGNRFSMQGPPHRESVANVGWVRMFFNSSITTKNTLANFNMRCTIDDVCSMDDTKIRGSTQYSEEATKKWKQKSSNTIERMPALWVSVGCLLFSTVLVIHTLICRFRQPKAPSQSRLNTPTTPSLPDASASQTTIDSYNILTEVPGVINSKEALILETNKEEREGCHSSLKGTYRLSFVAAPTNEEPSTALRSVHDLRDKPPMEIVTESTPPVPCVQVSTPSRQRIDHLAGLTALCAIFVTIMHFGLTFVPAIVIPGAPQHTAAEYWVQKIIAPFILNQMWLGVFFTTSVRFLTAPYLRKGNVEEIAKAAVRRTPRLMIPVATIAMLEYFLIDIGATAYLRYIPSLTWSTWPYVTRYRNFGQYISEILELVYLVPNAVPQITLHYCTGVLWTIAVQLQGTWLVTLGAIVVYEMKTPWKRMCYYAFCLLNHWYANSWGTYLWLGLLLTDLDMTYKYKKYLHARPAAYYPLIAFCWLCVLAGFAVNIIPNWTHTKFHFATAEHNIHPDPITGEAYMHTDNAGYPAYYTPRLNGLLFASGMQAIVELSPAVQWLLSTPPLLVLFPHIFTIYLLHGLVFWSWGSWLLVFLAERHLPYTINVAIVGVTSYALLFCCLPLVTPVLEALGKDLTAFIWGMAQEKSPERRATLFPFPRDLFLRREVNKGTEKDIDV